MSIWILVLSGVTAAICVVGVSMSFVVWKRLTEMLEYLETVEDDTRAIRRIETDADAPLSAEKGFAHAHGRPPPAALAAPAHGLRSWLRRRNPLRG